jgi:hypothetical protein
MNNPTDNDLIERYMLGKLTEAEIRDFEIRLGDDRELRRKLRLFKTFPEMMSEPARHEYEKILAEDAAPVVKKKPFRFMKPLYLILVAISFVVIIGIALLFIFIGKGHQKKNVVREENVIQKADVVKSEVPVKDTLVVAPPVPQPERKETREVTGGTGEKAIELLNPEDGTNFSRKEMILFNWTQKTDSFTRFYIFSERNDQVIFWRGIRLGIREYKVPGDYLYPGKYYWYVGTRKEKRTFIINE